DADELIVLVVRLETDVLTRLQRHQHQLHVGAGEQDAPEVVVRHGVALDVRNIAVHDRLRRLSWCSPGLQGRGHAGVAGGAPEFAPHGPRTIPYGARRSDITGSSRHTLERSMPKVGSERGARSDSRFRPLVQA